MSVVESPEDLGKSIPLEVKTKGPSKAGQFLDSRGDVSIEKVLVTKDLILRLISRSLVPITLPSSPI